MPCYQTRTVAIIWDGRTETMKRAFLLCIALLAFASGYAIQYEQVLNVPNATNFAWLDYDLDGDEDVLVTGNNITSLYRNDGTAGFADTGLPFAGFAEAEIHVADYNGDSYPDILISGYNTDNYNPDFDPIPFSTTYIYTNNCAGGFNGESIIFPHPYWSWIGTNVRNTHVSWFKSSYVLDFYYLIISAYDESDNFVCCYYSYEMWGSMTWQYQGYIAQTQTSITYSQMTVFESDIFIMTTGSGQNYEESTIITRYTGDFNYLSSTGIVAQLTPFTSGSMNIQDIDNDNDPDLFLLGDNTRLYRNSGGVFEDVTNQFPGLNYQSDIGDINGDGNVDILVSCLTVYLQNNDNTYTVSQTSNLSPGYSYKWLDYDQDGDLDFIQSWQNQTGYLHRNNGNLSFEYMLGSTLLGVNFSKWSTKDYDNDGDCDLTSIVSSWPGNVCRISRLTGDYSFTRMQLPFSNSYSSSWADYDNDGDQDVLVWGNGYTKLYANDGNISFSLGLDNLPNSYYTQWIDYDNDQLMDFCITTSNQIWLYKNIGGGNFTQINTNISISMAFFNYFSKMIDFGDYDNDGDLDLVVSNYYIPSVGRKNVIYRNEGNDTFVLTDIILDGFEVGTLDFLDFNNDGYLDVLAAGYNFGGPGQNYTQSLYRNSTNGKFVKVINGIPEEIRTGMAHCYDYDSDGDEDVIISGQQGYTNSSPGSITSRKYLNNGFGSFSLDTQFALYKSILANGGDFNNDGALDILTSTYMSNNAWVSHLYENVNNNFNQTCSGLSTIDAYDIPKWIDFNNDNKLDVFVQEYKPGFGYRHNLFINNLASANSNPTPPSISYDSAIGFTFSGSTDDTTPIIALTYNLRIGTIPGGSDIVCPMSNLSTGYRKVVEFGRHAWGPMDLPGDQTYYAAAQAIDNSYAGSAFGPEISFYVPPKPQLKLISSATLEFGEQYIGYDSAPQTISITNTGTATLVISDLIHSLADSPFHIVETGLPYTVAVGDTLNLTVIFCPANTSALADTLSLPYNGAYYHTQYITLSGTGIHVPPSVVENVQLNMQDDNAYLSWSPVHSTIFDVPLAVDRYVVIFSEDPYEAEHSFYYLGSTPDTSFVHPRVAMFRNHMFYKVKAVKFYDREQAAQFDNLIAGRNDLRWQDVVGLMDEVRNRRF